jgi:predicted nucleic acid-binding protein
VIVLDTNVLSEALRPRPAEAVIEWMRSQAAANLFTTTVCEAEILYGLALMSAGKRRTTLQAAVARIFEENFAGRVLPFDRLAAKSFASIAAARRASGNPLSAHDAQIAAIAHSCHATLATRNVVDFVECGIGIVNPWNGV